MLACQAGSPPEGAGLDPPHCQASRLTLPSPAPVPHRYAQEPLDLQDCELSQPFIKCPDPAVQS